MKQFTLTIECDNAAFENDPRSELSAILSSLSSTVWHNELYPNSAQWLRDTNGNRAGTYRYEER